MTPSLRHTALTGGQQERPLVSIAQAAQAWGMSEGALRRRVRCGLIEAVRASLRRGLVHRSGDGAIVARGAVVWRATRGAGQSGDGDEMTLLPLVPLLPAPRTITIFRGHCCWIANIPDWHAQDVPLPFREFICALQVKEHLRYLHPQVRIIFEEEPQ